MTSCPLSTQCQLLKVTRSVVYEQKKRLLKAVDEDEGLLLRLLDEEYTRHPFYGSRRMTKYLCGCGYAVNRKRVQRLMRTLGLVGMAPGPNTSKPHPQHKLYPYLLRGVDIIRPIRCGVPTSPIFGCRAALSIWWRSSTGTAARCWHGGCRIRWMPGFAWTVWKKPSRHYGTPRYSIVIKARNSPATLSPGY
jgi:hypothetical protein